MNIGHRKKGYFKIFSKKEIILTRFLVKKYGMVGNRTLKNSCMALKNTLSKRRCCFLATKRGFVAQMHASGETICLNVSF